MLRCKTAVEHFKSEKACKLLLKKWSVLIELVKVLKSAYLSTLSLQKSDITLSDFFGCVKILEIKLNQQVGKENRKTNLAKVLQATIKSRMEKLLDTPMMICALYLDPRYHCELKGNLIKIGLARSTIIDLWQRLKKIQNLSHSNETQQHDISSNSIHSNTSDLSDGNMESYLKELDKHYEIQGFQCTNSVPIGENNNLTADQEEMLTALKSFEKSVSAKRFKSSESIFKIWEQYKNLTSSHASEMYQIANAIFGIPPTQAAVERLFSALNFIFTNRRHNLKSDLLEDILLLHTNKSFVEMIFTNHLSKLVNKNQ